MGATSSQVRDRNEKRFQRNTLLKIEADINKLERSILKFKGLEENERFQDLQNHVQHIKSDLLRRSRRTHPELKNFHSKLIDRMDELLQLLVKTLNDNREQAASPKGLAAKLPTSPTESRKLEEIQETEEPVEEPAVNPEVKEKKQTVELKLIKVVNGTDEVERAQIREKKASVIKVGGVPVMPGEVMSTIAKQSNLISRRYSQRYSVHNDENHLKQINDIIEKLQAVEMDIYNFVGPKGGKRYEDIKNQLNLYLIDLNGMQVKDEDLEQLKRAKDYVGSCLNFLDQQATAQNRDDSLENYENEVFASLRNSDDVAANGSVPQDNLNSFAKVTTV